MPLISPAGADIGLQRRPDGSYSQSVEPLGIPAVMAPWKYSIGATPSDETEWNQDGGNQSIQRVLATNCGT
jgi:hypothetical protein